MIYLALLLVYSGAQIALGLWIGRRVQTSKDFFVAGRRLGPGLIFSTMLAANIGAGSTVGATALGYRDGLAGVWWVGSAAVGSIALALWIGPAMRRVAAAHDFRTVGDFLEFRFGVTVRTAIAVLLWVGAVFILAGQLIAIATILNAIVGVPPALGCAVGGLLITIYFTAGGLLTSAWVNVVQLTVKLLGFALALPLALSAAGGWSAVRAMQPTPDYWHFWQGGHSGVIYLAALGPAFVISPGLLQKIYGARDDRAVRLGVGANAIGLALYAIVPVLMGMIARLQFPDLATPQLALPTLLLHGVPVVVGAIGLAAVFSAELSAADAVLFMLTTSLSQDFYKRFVNPEAGDAQVLRITRFTAVIAGALGVIVAIIAADVVSALSIFYTLMAVGLFVPTLAGLFTKRASAPGALAAIITGVAIVAGLQIGYSGASVAGFTPPMVGLIGAFGAYIAVAGARSQKSEVGSQKSEVGSRKSVAGPNAQSPKPKA
jgi:SSS family solute:Na+ symporter